MVKNHPIAKLHMEINDETQYKELETYKKLKKSMVSSTKLCFKKEKKDQKRSSASWQWFDQCAWTLELKSKDILFQFNPVYF